VKGVPSQYFAVLSELVEDSGCDSALLLPEGRLTSGNIRIPDQWIDHRLFEQAVARAYQLTGNAALGLDFGERLNISSHTALGYAAMNCETLQQAITLFLRYYRILAFDLILQFTIDGDNCYFTVQDNSENSFRQGFNYECLFTAVNSSIRFLLQQQHLPIWFDIAAPAPSYADRYLELLGPSVRFGQAEHRLGCPTELLHTSLRGANPGLVKIYEAQCQQLLSQMDLDAPVSEKVRALLENSEGAFPRHKDAASLLAMSSRTLRRKLHEEQSSFQLLLDEVRSKRAIKYLQETRLPLSSIAYMLGFNDASNFRRAFQRWTGNKPLQYRP
jgi:AraC-like DNA-binding protein